MHITAKSSSTQRFCRMLGYRIISRVCLLSRHVRFIVVTWPLLTALFRLPSVLLGIVILEHYISFKLSDKMRFFILSLFLASLGSASPLCTSSTSAAPAPTPQKACTRICGGKDLKYYDTYGRLLCLLLGLVRGLIMQKVRSDD
ncbi:hypothetical protein DE146DRAFT_134232 [Phaeosphaeria sp. MPI-PUGE-AT-0046c]|nr:hypothetical protein DE146DRAFT_134232 [Phaeosphaeria sp. MPI-PUGE-AT-0046c]